MREKIKTKTGKLVELPARLYTKKDLKKMGIDYVENKIFFNKISPKDKFPKIKDLIKENMSILNYQDFSNTLFKSVEDFIEKLKNSAKEQNSADSDYIILPVCKNESIKNQTDFYLRAKFSLAEELRLEYDKEIIVEMHYKSEIPNSELTKLSKSIDYLSIFFGIPYGHYPSFKKLVKRVCFFKNNTNKLVFCMGVPLKFSGDSMTEVHFMPCFDIITDMWSKCWRKGGGPRQIKVVDEVDFESKNEIEWLKSGYTYDQLLLPINRTVAELFLPENKEIREEYESYILDEAIREIARLNPLTIDGFLGKKFDEKYVRLISIAYREKLILRLFRNAKEISSYSEEERNLLENRIRTNHYEPLAVWFVINKLKTTIQTKGTIKVNELIKEIDRFDFEL